VVTILPSVHSGPLGYYTIAELEEMGQLRSSGLDDHDMPELPAAEPMASPVVVGTVPTTRAGGTGRPMVWPTTVRGMPAPHFGWE
jgi:hypothetical protein